MLFEEISEEIYEAKLVYARKGRSIVRKYRCGSAEDSKVKQSQRLVLVLNQLI